MMNKKILLIPTLTLSAAILLSGCTGGNSNENPIGSPTPSASSSTSEITPSPSPTETSEEDVEVVSDYVAPPEGMEAKYHGFYFNPAIEEEGSWEYFKNIGAKLYEEDPAPRSTTVEEFRALMGDQKNLTAGDKVYGEYFSDVEQTALNVSEYLKKNPKATTEELNGNEDLIVNRYEKMGSIVIEKDSSTGFYFSVFHMNDQAPGYGIIVPQKGITPDF